MAKKRLRAVFFGPHGSGKRTQAERLALEFRVPLISSGALLREEIESETAIGKLVMNYVEQGMLAPDDLVNAVILKKIRRCVMNERGFVLEGYPRNVEQASALEKVSKTQIALHLKLSDEEARERVEGRRECTSCNAVYHLDTVPPGELETCVRCGYGLQGRPTDQEEAFISRQAVYHFMTEPLVGFYRQKGVLLTLKAQQSIRALHEELLKKLKRLGF